MPDRPATTEPRPRRDLDHRYAATVRWEGWTGDGYRAYDRAHHASTDPPTVPLRLSSDPAFRGDPALLNPEQLLVTAAASCQLLSFLAVAARERLDVIAYADDATGEMPHAPGTPMSITRIVLRPRVTVRADGTDPASLAARVTALLDRAHDECYIANSLRTAVIIEPTIEVAEARTDRPIPGSAT
jgi:organic hydroperoxide reductase OsmC/OhrA